MINRKRNIVNTLSYATDDPRSEQFKQREQKRHLNFYHKPDYTILRQYNSKKFKSKFRASFLNDLNKPLLSTSQNKKPEVFGLKSGSEITTTFQNLYYNRARYNERMKVDPETLKSRKPTTPSNNLSKTCYTTLHKRPPKTALTSFERANFSRNSPASRSPSYSPCRKSQTTGSHYAASLGILSSFLAPNNDSRPQTQNYVQRPNLKKFNRNKLETYGGKEHKKYEPLSGISLPTEATDLCETNEILL